MQVYAAAISKPFQAWNEIENDVEYLAPENRIIEEVESLIIYSHQPVYNTRSKGGAQNLGGDLVIFRITSYNVCYTKLLRDEVAS